MLPGDYISSKKLYAPQVVNKLAISPRAMQDVRAVRMRWHVVCACAIRLVVKQPQLSSFITVVNHKATFWRQTLHS